MEPRPPRPRQQYLPQDAASTAGGYQRGGDQGMYAPQPGYGAAPTPYPPELDLVPRQERYRQRIARNVLIALVALVALGALAWNVRDRFFSGTPDNNVAVLAPTAEPSQIAVVTDGGTPAAGDEAPTQAPLVNNLLATSTPTPEDNGGGTGEEEAPADQAAADSEPTQAPAAEPEEEADQAPVDPAAQLPDETQLPVQGLPLSNSGDRTLSEVVASFGGPDGQAEAETLLQEWGWEANPFTEFYADPSTLSPDATYFLSVSIHQFANQESALEALPYFSNVVIALQGYSEVQADPMGDEIRLLRQVSEDGTTNVAAYIVDGPLLYRLGASSLAGDPTGHVLQLADTLLAGE